MNLSLVRLLEDNQAQVIKVHSGRNLPREVDGEIPSLLKFSYFLYLLDERDVISNNKYCGVAAARP